MVPWTALLFLGKGGGAGIARGETGKGVLIPSHTTETGMCEPLLNARSHYRVLIPSHTTETGMPRAIRITPANGDEEAPGLPWLEASRSIRAPEDTRTNVARSSRLIKAMMPRRCFGLTKWSGGIWP
jgi:hypothetical protein